MDGDYKFLANSVIHWIIRRVSFNMVVEICSHAFLYILTEKTTTSDISIILIVWIYTYACICIPSYLQTYRRFYNMHKCKLMIMAVAYMRKLN